MLPKGTNVEVIQDFEKITYPDFTYKMNIEEETIVGDVTDFFYAVFQACYKILNTERYAHAIYSWGYGCEIAELFGKPIPYVYSELPRRIREALLYDDRVLDVVDFQLSHKKNDVMTTFKVVTKYGTVDMEKGVRIG